MSDLYGYDYSAQEIALLKEHDEYEELHPFTQNEDDESDFRCHWYSGPDGDGIPCGDTAEGLMHNNTWRNVEPLIDLDACSNGCIDPENHKEF